MSHLIPADRPALTLRALSKHYGGIEDPERDDTYSFDRGDDALKVARELSAMPNIPAPILSRPTLLRVRRGKLLWDVAKHDGDVFAGASVQGKREQRWVLNLGVAVDQRPIDEQLVPVDELIRCAVAQTELGMASVGMFGRDKDGAWRRHRDNYILRCFLLSKGIPRNEIDVFIGTAVLHPWTLDHRPFAPEFPGGRIWNRGAPQLAFKAADVAGPHPHWDLILTHCFCDLDFALKHDEWAKRVGMTSGYKYGLAWTANVFRYPFERLPYLFFYGEQNSGKSIYHEALALLTTKGVASADRALTNSNDFNGELAGAVLAYIEEKDISKSPGSYAKVKDWVTSPVVWIRKMGTDAYAQRNTLHFVQCANDRSACPIEFGDTRIVAMYVAPLQREIPKPRLIQHLRDEAPNFLRTILDLELPEPEGRLRLPAVGTAGKESLALSSVSEMAQVVTEAMADKSTWKGAASDLVSLLGPGQWPTDARIVKRELSSAEAYLRQQGITVTWGPKGNKGRTLSIARKSTT